MTTSKKTTTTKQTQAQKIESLTASVAQLTAVIAQLAQREVAAPAPAQAAPAPAPAPAPKRAHRPPEEVIAHREAALSAARNRPNGTVAKKFSKTDWERADAVAQQLGWTNYRVLSRAYHAVTNKD